MNLCAPQAHALAILKRLHAVEHTWEKQALVVQATRPQADVERILEALGVRLPSLVIRVTTAHTAA